MKKDVCVHVDQGQALQYLIERCVFVRIGIFVVVTVFDIVELYQGYITKKDMIKTQRYFK